VIEKDGILIIRAQDIQKGIGKNQVPYDFLLKVGGAATLSLYIRGMGFIHYQLLKDFAYEYLDIAYPIFDNLINILQEIDFVEIVKKGSNKFINPKVPYFEDFYNTLGRYAKEEKKFDERELISLEILDRLSSSPHRKEALYLTDDKKLIDWVIDIGKKGSYMDTIESQNIVYSPIYFMENINELDNLITKYGEENVAKAVDAVKKWEGLPIDLIDTFVKDEGIKKIVTALISKKILQPTYVKDRLFAFTPIYSTEKINVINRKLYEKAVALISAVRYGQYFAQHKIISPVNVLNALKREGVLRATTYAKIQYARPELVGVLQLKPKGSGFYEVCLIDTPENRKIIDLSIQLLNYGEVLQERGIDQKLREKLEYGEFKDILPSYKIAEERLSIDKHSLKKVEEMIVFGV